MRFNLTNESFLPSVVSNFPAASTLKLSEMICASLFYNIIPILVSLVSYYFIVLFVDYLPIHKRVFRNVISGFLLTTTTPLLYITIENYLGKNQILNAEIIAWIFLYFISIISYCYFNRNRERNDFKV